MNAIATETNAPISSARVIRQLPPHLVNQIAAGEVIERPSSVVKELLENSIDAGSTRIEVTIEGGGVELIRISDDGCGMTANQLPMAVTSHATSKLPDDESLFHVGTLGFRGEALASIASVSQMTLRSRADGVTGHAGGHQLDVRGGVIEPVSPAGCPVGTVIEVRNLFFNTPVRRKFLKTPQTERGHIVEAFTRLALANPNVHFVFRSGDKEVYDLLPTARWADRIEAFFGGEVCEALIPIESDDPPVRIRGYACDPSVSRGNNRMQYLFLNGRHIRDRALQHALGEAYRGLLMVGRHPICFLRMEMPADMIDVNVHPAKLEVRFTDSGRVYSRLLQTLRQRFLSTDMTHRAVPIAPTDNSTATTNHPAPVPDAGVLGLPATAIQNERQSVIAWARGDDVSESSKSMGWIGRGDVAAFRPFPNGGTPIESPQGSAPGFPRDPPTIRAEDDLVESTTPNNHRAESSPSVSHLGFQVHNRYLVTQDDRGMVVIDQHALHERVLYERVCKRVLGDEGCLESQRLLVPEPVSLTSAERSAVLGVADSLARIGLEVAEFGGDSIVIQSYPAILPHHRPAEMLRTLLETVMAAGRDPDPRDLLNHLLSTVACKAAVKAGDPLAPEEITSLLEQKDLYSDTHHCPHGRPTALFFSRDELDRMFGRT
ncbi:MAG: DNA mismatch repair endonuclease MutL [Planctomycetota bacterium]